MWVGLEGGSEGVHREAEGRAEGDAEGFKGAEAAGAQRLRELALDHRDDAGDLVDAAGVG